MKSIRFNRLPIRFYHSQHHLVSNRIINPDIIEHKILTKSLEFIPKYGFKDSCITQAIKDLKYPDSIMSVLTTSFQGNSLELQLMIHWLKTQRENMAKSIEDEQFQNLSEYDRVKYLINKRLELNVPIKDKLSEGISYLMVPYNFSHSLGELHNLGDDIAFYAGDQSNDFAWYSKRFSFSSVYVASELYMLSDTSKNHTNTKKFVDDQVEGVKSLGTGYENTEQWLFFNTIGLANLIKSQLLRG